MSGYNRAEEENVMRAPIWLIVLLLLAALLAVPRALYACPS